MTKIKLGGIYRHFKGNLYRVIDTVKHSETNEEMVLYECLYENSESKLWVRPIKMFTETIEFEGKHVKRFESITKK